MPARTVEDKYKRAVDDLYLGAWMLREGKDGVRVEERLDWLAARLEDAREYHLKTLKKREGKRYASEVAHARASQEAALRLADEKREG